jgi:hypothetical protein
MATTRKPKNVVKTFEQIEADFGTIAATALESSVVYEQKCRELADLIVDLRGLHTYKGKETTYNDDGSVKTPGVPAGTDWRGLSAKYNEEKDQLWAAAYPKGSAFDWMARTGKTESELPLRKNVAYHLEIALVARLGKPTCEKWGIETRTRAQRKADAAKKREADKKGPNETAADEFTKNGVPVAGNIIETLKKAQRAINALEGASVGLDVQATLFMLLTNLSRTGSAVATDLVSPVKAAA